MKPEIITAFIIYLTVINLAGFFSMFIDKRRAIKTKWRISEQTLFIIAIVGGSIGSLLGMRIFRHKTKHIQFTFGIPAILIMQIIIALFIIV